MSVENKVRNYIRENILFSQDESLLDVNDSFLEKRIIDSTGILEVIFFLEETFGIEMADEEMVPANLDSVNRIAAYVARKKS